MNCNNKVGRRGISKGGAVYREAGGIRGRRAVPQEEGWMRGRRVGCGGLRSDTLGGAVIGGGWEKRQKLGFGYGGEDGRMAISVTGDDGLYSIYHARDI